MSTVAWWTDDETGGGAARLWTDAAATGWLPARLGRVIVHVDAKAHPALVRDTARALISLLGARSAPPRVEVIDADCTATWSGVPRLDLGTAPRYLVETACLRDGAWIPEAWLDDVFVVTIVGVAPDPGFRIRNVLAAQAGLLDAPSAMDLDAAFVAHRLLRSSLCVACGTVRWADVRSESWWATSPDDIALERVIARQCGVPPDSLPVMRHLARHELRAAAMDPPADNAPRLEGYAAPSWRVTTTRTRAIVGERARRTVVDLRLGVQNLRRLPTFVQRRMPALGRLGRGA